MVPIYLSAWSYSLTGIALRVISALCTMADITESIPLARDVLELNGHRHSMAYHRRSSSNRLEAVNAFCDRVVVDL
jgi:hypothetical protein